MLTQQEKQTIIDETSAELEKIKYRKLVEDALIQTEGLKADEVKEDLLKASGDLDGPITVKEDPDSPKDINGK